MTPLSRAGLTALSIAVCLPGQDAGFTVAVRSLAPFARPALQDPGGPASALPTEESYGMTPSLDPRGRTRVPEWPLEVLTARHRAAIDAGELSLQFGAREQEDQGGKLDADTIVVVQGTQAAVAACVRDLDAMAECVARPIEVTAWRLPLADGPLPAAVWRADELRQRLAQAPPLWTARGRARSGSAVRLARETWRPHVRDLDVEVAEKSHIADPKVDAAFAGVRVSLIAHELPNDQLVLTGQWLLSEVVAVTEQGTGEGQPTIDTPEHRTAFATFSGRIASGGALVVSGRGGALGPNGFVLVVGARFVSPPAPDPAPDVLVRPVGAFLAGDRVTLPFAEFAWPGVDRSPELPAGGLSPQLLGEALAGAAGAGVQVHGGVCVAYGEPRTCQRTTVMLRELSEVLTGVAVHSTLRTAGGAAGADSIELLQPALLERTGAAFVGRERAVVQDFEVEIAARAEAANPVVRRARSGLSAHFRVAPLGSRLATAGLWLATTSEPPRERTLREKPPMTMQQVDVHAAAFPWDGEMPVDQELVLGSGPPLAAGADASELAVRLVR